MEDQQSLSPRNKSHSATSLNNDKIDTDMYQVENWKNHGKSPSKATFKRAHNSILNFNQKFKSAPLLANGSRQSEGKGHIIVTTHTCAFDTIFSIYASAYLNVDHVRLNIDASNSDFSALIKHTCSPGAPLNDTTYKLRTALLQKIFSSEHFYKGAITADENVTYINCTAGIATFFSRLASNGNDVLNSSRISKSCKPCGQEAKVSSQPLIPVELSFICLDKLEENITGFNRKPYCKVCKEKRSVDIVISDLVAFDVEPCTETNQQPPRNHSLKWYSLPIIRAH